VKGALVKITNQQTKLVTKTNTLGMLAPGGQDAEISGNIQVL
jgi:hypothetical protein